MLDTSNTSRELRERKPTPNPDLLPTPDAAAHVHLSSQYLEKLRITGGGPRFLKLGRVVRYRKVDLDVWLEGQLRTSTSDRGERADD